MANKIVHEKGKAFDVSSMHGKWCNITFVGNDICYAQVGIIGSVRDYIYFQYKDRKGIAAKSFIKDLTECRMNERKLKRQQELIVEENWDEGKNPYEMFLGKRCDIHIHSTHMFEGNPGLFAALILETEQGRVTVKENGKTFDLNQYMITGMMESQYE